MKFIKCSLAGIDEKYCDMEFFHSVSDIRRSRISITFMYHHYESMFLERKNAKITSAVKDLKATREKFCNRINYNLFIWIRRKIK